MFHQLPPDSAVIALPASNHSAAATTQQQLVMAGIEGPQARCKRRSRSIALVLQGSSVRGSSGNLAVIAYPETEAGVGRVGKVAAVSAAARTQTARCPPTHLPCMRNRPTTRHRQSTAPSRSALRGRCRGGRPVREPQPGNYEPDIGLCWFCSAQWHATFAHIVLGG
jgi:hypothetical protein